MAFSTSKRSLVIFPRMTNDIWKLSPGLSGTMELVGAVPGPSLGLSTLATMVSRNNVMLVHGGQLATIVNIKNPDKPVSVPTGSLREPRFWANMVPLPNGEVLVVGGASVIQSLDYAVRYAEVWNPVTGLWRVGATAEKSRLYHSAALLLPDATVLVGGGGRDGPEINQNAEIYSPSYLFAADGSLAVRPVITSVGDLTYGGAIPVAYTSLTGAISRVSLVRMGSITHAFDMDVRLVELAFKPVVSNGSISTTVMNVRIPNRSVCPPGWYMLFIMDDMGVPSVAEIVSLL
jgi:Domain of unknown function (DUF1929)